MGAYQHQGRGALLQPACTVKPGFLIEVEEYERPVIVQWAESTAPGVVAFEVIRWERPARHGQSGRSVREWITRRMNEAVRVCTSALESAPTMEGAAA